MPVPVQDPRGRPRPQASTPGPRWPWSTTLANAAFRWRGRLVARSAARQRGHEVYFRPPAQPFERYLGRRGRACRSVHRAGVALAKEADRKKHRANRARPALESTSSSFSIRITRAKIPPKPTGSSLHIRRRTDTGKKHSGAKSMAVRVYRARQALRGTGSAGTLRRGSGAAARAELLPASTKRIVRSSGSARLTLVDNRRITKMLRVE